MNEKVRFKIRKMLLLSTKIAVGSSIAIYIAELLNLQYATSAGIITLLTLITTKWETVKLSFLRLLTYAISVAICWCVFSIIPSMWVEYGVFLFLIVFIGEKMGWRSTLSVNAVIGTHFLTTQDFSFDFLINELLLVVIGITIAFVFNLVHINNAHEQGIIRSMRHVEHEMKQILIELAGYLCQKASGDRVWEDIRKLETELDEYLELAYEYQNNTFQSHPEYYISYFEMRMKQCGALHNLHSEMRRMRQMPKQAHIVSDYIYEITQHVTEMNNPKKQMDELEQLVENLRNEPLPETHEEFENRAELYHTLLDLEEFLMYKKRFIESIDATQFRIYWKKEIEGK
ncbi:MAG: hypothetical protein IJZ53_12935 [Tyzzerella sp.]|nr:hypothetical protein [Tyzzerella sp.]